MKYCSWVEVVEYYLEFYSGSVFGWAGGLTRRHYGSEIGTFPLVSNSALSPPRYQTTFILNYPMCALQLTTPFYVVLCYAVIGLLPVWVRVSRCCVTSRSWPMLSTDFIVIQL